MLPSSIHAQDSAHCAACDLELSPYNDLTVCAQKVCFVCKDLWETVSGRNWWREQKRLADAEESRRKKLIQND